MLAFVFPTLPFISSHTISSKKMRITFISFCIFYLPSLSALLHQGLRQFV
ncbi:hypothetical protein EDC54_11413 [Samsonia erythrinae]|uniref:Uncharacterized protein n=1 Tax=Samsonia erythrinae TaxID=160434 RepID=A0A4R3VIK5_9GAMM|nr:hypothetical protein EDC54_11413 [Samsonia erythrinae]